MDRLTMRMSNGQVVCTHPLRYYTYDDFVKVLERLATYEDAEEKRRLVILPCNIGDKIYKIKEDCEYEHTCPPTWDCDNCEYDHPYIEQTLFRLSCLRHDMKLTYPYYLTREEAEKALEKKEWLNTLA